MKKAIKKITALLMVLTMMFTAVPVAFAGVEYSVEDAYEECAAEYPEFVDAVLAQGVTEKQIIGFLADVQGYLLDLDVEITEENFEDYFIEAILDTMAKRKHVKVRDALAAAFPDAVVAGMDGVIAPEFEPLVETIKRIIFDNGMLEDEVTVPTEEETKPTEPEPTEKPTEEEEKPIEPSTEKPTEEEKPTEAPTEEPTEEIPTQAPTKGDNGTGGPVGGEEDVEDVTDAPVQNVTTPVFSDMNQAPWAETAVKALVDRKIINGYPDGTFKPNNAITRAEFAKIIVLASGRYSPAQEKYTSTFTDVLATSWEYPYVSAAYKYGFIKGRSETIFDPNSNITRGDLCLIVYRYIKSVNPEFKPKADANGIIPTFADSASVPVWSQEAVSALYSNGVAPVRDTVNNKFEPNLPATRAECALIVYNAINAALGLKK